MKKNKIAKIIWLCVIYVLAAVYSVVFFISVYKGPISIPIGIVGALLLYILNALIHECGHLAAAKIYGFKPIKFSFSVFNFDFTQKKVKFYLRRSDYAGETDVVPTKSGNYVKRYTAVLIGGLAGGFLSFVLFALLFFIFAFNGYIAALFASFPLVLASFLINMIPRLLPNSDGAFIVAVTDEKNRRSIDAYFEILYLLNDGKTFAEMPSELFFSRDMGDLMYQEAKLCELMLAEEIGDREKILSAANDLFTLEFRLEDVGRELVYAYSVLGDREKINALQAEIASCDKANDLRSKRALIAYAKLRDDEKYVEVAMPTALKECKEWYLKGEGRFNEKLIEKI